MQSGREVGSGVVNLGNTCYINSVLQALAHAPELCMAIECEPHRMHCPIYLKKHKHLQKESNGNDEEEELKDDNDDEDDEEHDEELDEKMKKEAQALDSINFDIDLFPVPGETESIDHEPAKVESIPKEIEQEEEAEEEEEETDFCILCEMEEHLINVHRNRIRAADANMNIASGMNMNMNMNMNTTTSASSEAQAGAVSPSSFVDGFIEHIAPSWFEKGKQEDSHEFLRLLIDAMQKSAVKWRNNPANNTAIKSNPDDDNNANDTQNKSGNEYSFRLFCGKVQSIVRCSHCNATSSKIDPIEDIGLEVNNFSPTKTTSSSSTSSYHKKNPYSSYGTSSSRGSSHSRSTSPLQNSHSSTLTDVTSSLERFIATEHLDSGYKCESCGKGGKATKESRLASIPPILTLHLKRFRYGNDKAIMSPPVSSRRGSSASSWNSGMYGGSGMGGGGGSMRDSIGSSGSAKIEGHVKFPQVFDIRPYLTKEKQAGVKSMLCRLFAVIVHAGKNSHSGHYICYVRNVQKNEWWKMDDARVVMVRKEEVEAAEAYMLFYNVMNHPVSLELKRKEKAMMEEMEKERQRQQKERERERQLQEEQQKQKLEEEEEKKRIEMEMEMKMKMTVKREDNEKLDAKDSVKDENMAEVKTKKRTAMTEAQLKILKRKRETPEYKSGEEWARKMTTKPKAILQTIRTVQDYFSERIELKPDYARCIEEEVENIVAGTKAHNGTGGGGPSFGVSIDKDVQNVEIMNAFRHALWTLFQKILPKDEKDLNMLFKQPKKDMDSHSNVNGPNDVGGKENDAKMISKDVGMENKTHLIIPVVDQSETLI